MIYKIADIIVEMEVKYEPLSSQIKAYEIKEYDEVDVKLNVTEDEFQKFSTVYPNFSKGDAEYLIYGSKFYSCLVKKNGLLYYSRILSIMQ